QGINGSGEVVGERNGLAGRIFFRWSQERGMEDLKWFDSDSYGAALAIADNGDIVGYSGHIDQSETVERAVLWSRDGTKKIIDECRGGYVGWDFSYYCPASANAINSVGQIAGKDADGAFRLTGEIRQYIPDITGSYS